MSHPVTRVLTMLELLQGHAGLTGAGLAERLGTDIRTVRRYVAHLRELGIPVEAERGRYGGYRLARGYRMPPLMLTNDEALAVVLGLLAARRLGLSSASPASAGALAKIDRVLPHSLREPLEAMRETLSFTAKAVVGQAPETGVLLALALASRGGETVGVHYQSWREDRSERDIDPYGVIFHGGRWYVVGHDHSRDGLRTFRIDRVSAVTPRARRFTIPDGFDPVEHLTSALARVPYRWQVEVVIDGPLDEIVRRLPPTVATLAPAPRRCADARPGGQPGRDGQTARLAGMAVHHPATR